MNPTLVRAWRRLRSTGLISLLMLVAAVFSFRSAVADWHDVPTGSMKPTILIGDRIFVNKLAYDLRIPFTDVRLASWADPARGDIVTCWSPADGARLVKRVIGLPGDVVALRDNHLIINGRPVAYHRVDDPELSLSMGTEGGDASFLREELPGRTHLIALQETRQARRDLPPVRVPDGAYLVMGDNRDRSADSRYFGFVDREDITGRVPGLAASLDYERGYRPRWSRFFAHLL